MEKLKIDELSNVSETHAYELGLEVGRSWETQALSKTQAANERNILVVGPHRAGKDTICQWFALNTKLKFNGTSSFASLPLISQVCDASYEEIYRRRHSFKMFMYHFLNGVRDVDILTLPRLTLQGSNFLCGVRSLKEMRAGSALCSMAIWVENPDCMVDPTLEFTIHHVYEVFGNSLTSIYNDLASPKSYLYLQLLSFCHRYGIQVFPNPHVSFERHGIKFVE